MKFDLKWQRIIGFTTSPQDREVHYHPIVGKTR
jgi:hypothetical protein